MALIKPKEVQEELHSAVAQLNAILLKFEKRLEALEEAKPKAVRNGK